MEALHIVVIVYAGFVSILILLFLLSLIYLVVHSGCKGTSNQPSTEVENTMAMASLGSSSINENVTRNSRPSTGRHAAKNQQRMGMGSSTFDV